MSGERERGRPRTFEDAAAFHATSRVIADLGYPKLTLAAVARNVGCSAQTLIDRFGSKQQLMRAYLLWTIVQAEGHFAAMWATEGSRIAALRKLLVEPLPSRPESNPAPESAPNAHAFLAEARSDPELRLLMEQRRAIFEREIIASLEAARLAGELHACDTTRLGRLLHVAITGVMVLWTPERSESALMELGQVFDEMIELFQMPVPVS